MEVAEQKLVPVLTPLIGRILTGFRLKTGVADPSVVLDLPERTFSVDKRSIGVLVYTHRNNGEDLPSGSNGEC